MSFFEILHVKKYILTITYYVLKYIVLGLITLTGQIFFTFLPVPVKRSPTKVAPCSRPCSTSSLVSKREEKTRISPSAAVDSDGAG